MEPIPNEVTPLGESQMQRCYRLQLLNWTIRLPGGVPNLLTPATLYTSVDPIHPHQRYNGDNISDLCSYHRDGHARTAVSMVEVGGFEPPSSPLIMMLSTSA